MKPEEARIGLRVRVRESLLRAGPRGKEGTIAGIWGHPEYAAFDVLFDDGARNCSGTTSWRRSRAAPEAGG